jgi:two-component system LytT family response regulator
MKRYTALIVDDEPLARRTLWRLLSREADFEVTGEAVDGPAALAAIETRDPDVVFLDIRIPRLDGLQVARHLHGDGAPLVVMVTAYEQHAVDAFDVQAVDYLLKPYDDDRFAACMARVRHRLETEGLADLQRRTLAVLGMPGSPLGRERDATPGRIPVRVADGTWFLDTTRIDWIEARGYQSLLHVGGSTFPLRESLTRLEGILDPRRFVRIHRSAIARIGFIRQIQPLARGDYAVILDDGTRLRLSRTRRAEVLPLLGLRAADPSADRTGPT